MEEQPTRAAYPLDRLDYNLPKELIAQSPAAERSGSRLLQIRVAERAMDDLRFVNLPDLLPPETLIVMNDSRVILARVYGRRESGGRVEVLFLRYVSDGLCEALLGSNARLSVSEDIGLPGDWRMTLLEGKSNEGTLVRFYNASGFPAEREELHAWLADYGLPPLPPYVRRPRPDDYDSDRQRARPEDVERYQTVYAKTAGSVAAPTAGLHFDAAMLERLKKAGHSIGYVTLHVGLGTFAPLQAEDLGAHRMHEEVFSMPSELRTRYLERIASGRPVLAVGTTSLRVLHTVLERERSAAAGIHSEVEEQELQGEWGSTSAFIYPGHGTRACDMLLTNFHLPKSTLLALVYAFGGEELLRSAYRHAIDEAYRFFSYGDCMLIDRRGAAIDETGTVRA